MAIIAANGALFVQKKLWFRVRVNSVSVVSVGVGVSCRSGVSATSFKDII